MTVRGAIGHWECPVRRIPTQEKRMLPYSGESNPSNGPTCIGCGEYYASASEKLCSVCSKHPELFIVENGDRHVAQALNRTLLVRYEEETVERRMYYVQNMVAQMISNIRTQQARVAYAAFRTLCSPRQPWSFEMIGFLRQHVGPLTMEEAKPLLRYFAEQFYDRPHVLLGLQSAIACNVMDRVTLRHLIRSQRPGDLPIFGTVFIDCYYGKDQVLLTRPDKKWHHQEDWGKIGHGPHFPKWVYDCDFYAIATLLLRTPFPKVLCRYIAENYFSPADWAINAFPETKRLLKSKRN